MSWLRRRRNSVPGISPNSSPDGWYDYNGARLANRPVVAAALDRAPRHFADLVFSPGDPDMALTREEFLAGITVGTNDGVSWTVSLAEELKAVVDTGPDVVDDDLLLAALAERPEVSEAQHPDREVFEVTLASPLRADEMLAVAVAAVSAAHRQLAQRLRIELAG